MSAATRRLTPDVVTSAHSRMNAASDYELDLRGRKIPAIENLAVTEVSLDFSAGPVLPVSHAGPPPPPIPPSPPSPPAGRVRRH